MSRPISRSSGEGAGSEQCRSYMVWRPRSRGSLSRAVGAKMYRMLAKHPDRDTAAMR